MRDFTVIGYYEGDGQVFADNVRAESAYDAMQISANSARECNSDLFILGAVEGWHQLVAACEDSGCLAHAKDLMGD